MVRTNSTMLPLGTALPKFDLAVVPGTYLKVDGKKVYFDRFSSDALLEKPLLLMFLCAHCPFVKHLEEELARLGQDYADRVQILAIASNSLISHPQDGSENLAAQAKKFSWSFPYLLDVDQSLAKSMKAACTPDFFLFSPSSGGKQFLQYRGQLDSSRPGNTIPVNGCDLRRALDCVLNAQVPPIHQIPSIGCNIKWHPGEEPSWFG